MTKQKSRKQMRDNGVAARRHALMTMFIFEHYIFVIYKTFFFTRNTHTHILYKYVCQVMHCFSGSRGTMDFARLMVQWAVLVPLFALSWGWKLSKSWPTKPRMQCTYIYIYILCWSTSTYFTGLYLLIMTRYMRCLISIVSFGTFE